MQKAKESEETFTSEELFNFQCFYHSKQSRINKPNSNKLYVIHVANGSSADFS